MDIWHRVGRIVRFSNLGTLLFFTLNILLIVAVFGSSGSIVELICIYFFTVAISLSPLGEMCLAAFAGASDIKRVDIKLRVVPLVQYVLDAISSSCASSTPSAATPKVRSIASMT